MSRTCPMTWPYDLIAAFYDEDMGRNTDARDVAWYVAQAGAAARAAGGAPVVELGCGTGRVTLPLAAAGLEIVAADRSAPMIGELARKAAAAGLAHRIAPVVLDMGRPALAGRFAAVLCPYSAFGYLIEDEDRGRLLDWVRAALLPGGVFLLDMFVPDPTVERLPEGTEIHDYRRPLPPDGRWAPATALARSKRLSRDARPGVNRIERHYRFLDEAGHTLRAVRTESLQRPYPPDALLAVLREAGFADLRACGDFQPDVPAGAPARMTAVIAQPTNSRPTNSRPSQS